MQAGDALTEKNSPPRRRRFRWALWAVLVPVGILLLAILLGWLMRKSIVEQALASYCSDRELSCSADVLQLSSSRALIGDLQITSGEHTPFSVERISVELAWEGLFAPTVSAIHVEAPTLRAAIEDGSLTLHGLEKLAQSSGNEGGGAVPEVTLQEGRLVLSTSAGDVAASVALDGNFPQNGILRAELDPVKLQTDRGEVIWSKGEVDLKAINGVVSGDVDLLLESAAVDGISISDGILSANLTADTPNSNGSTAVKLSWQASVADGAFPSGKVSGAQTEGVAQFSHLPELSLAAFSDAMMSADLSAETGPFERGDLKAAQAMVRLDVTQTDGRLSGPVSVELKDASAPQGRVQSAVIDGAINRDAGGLLGFDGAVDLAGAALSPTLKASLLRPVGLPGPLQAHGAALKSALSRGLSKFDVSTQLSALLEKDVVSLSSLSATKMTSPTGLVVSIKPKAGETWIETRGGDFALRGALSVSGGGAPTVFARIDDLSRGEDGFVMRGPRFDLKSWQTGNRTVSANLAPYNIALKGETIRAATEGTLRLAGPFSGADLNATELSGGVSVQRRASGWAVKTVGEACLDLSSQGVSFGGLTVEPLASQICPDDGWFIRQTGQAPSGAFGLGELIIPFSTNSGGGQLTLENARVDWASEDGLTMAIAGEQFRLPLTIGSRLLSVDGSSPRLGLRAGNGPLQLTARLGATRFGGTMIPAKVSADSFSFDGTSQADGISGALDAAAVLIQDLGDDPIYQPLVSDMTATLDKGQMVLAGPLRIRKGGVTIGAIRSDLDIVELTGTASVEARRLEFRPGGLQPAMLSDRLTGLFTNANGVISGLAAFDIKKGKLAGRGKFGAEDFGFQTTALGRVEGVNGAVEFDNLLSLSTPPGQTVTIDSINPGIPFTGGKLSFQLVDGKALVMEALSFPFAGGALSLTPTTWKLGGEDQRLELRAEKVELEQIVAVLNVPDLEAKGTVSGAIPVEVTKTGAYIRKASLKADDRGGRLAYTGKAAENAAQANQNVEMAFNALKNFQFSVLELGIDGDLADRIVVSLNILGRNPEVLGGKAFDFKIAVGSELSELLKSGKNFGSHSWMVDEANRQAATLKATESAAPNE
jgi:hypothetical protein